MPEQRLKTILKASIVAIITNVALGIFKAFVGVISHSIAITMDAVNNFTDAASSLITIFGAAFAAKDADKKHPFGYGRIEFLTSLLIAVLIQVTVSSIITTFVMLDAYSILYNMPKSVILSMCQKINPAIDDLGIKFLLMVALPFNALKDAIVFVVTFLLYKRLRMIFKKIDAQKN